MARPVRLVFLSDDKALQASLAKLGTQAEVAKRKFASLGSIGKDMRKVGSSLTMGITVPVGLAAIEAVKLASTFETTMVKIQNLAAPVGTTKKQFDQWNESVLALSRSLGTAPQELADGLYYILSSGGDASKALDTLKASAMGAAIGLGTTTTVADAVTSAMNAYTKSGLTATDATNILMRAVKNGKGEATQIANSIGLVIPLASELGVSFGDVAAGMAAITQTGSNAAEASTQLRGIFNALLNPSAEGAKAISAYGMSVEGLKDSLRNSGLLATLELMKEKVGGNTEALDAMFPNVRGLLGVLSLVGDGGRDVAAVFQDVKNGTDNINDAFSRVEKTSAHRLEKALSTLKAAAIDLAQRMAPAIEMVSHAFENLVKALDKLTPAQKDAIVRFLGILAVVGPLLYVFGSLVRIFFLLSRHPILTALGALIILFANLYAANEDFRKSVNRVAAALKDAAKWLWEHHAAIEAVIGSLLAFYATARVLSGLMALGGAIGFLIKHKKQLSMVVDILSALLRFKLAAAAGTAAKALKGMGLASLLSPWGLIIAAVVALGVGLFIAYKRSETFREKVNAAWKKVGEGAQWLWEKIKQFAEGVKKWFGTYLSEPIAAFGREVGKTFDVVIGAVKKVWPHLVRVGEWIAGKFSGGGGAGEFLGRWYQAVVWVATNVVKYFRFMIEGLIALWSRIIPFVVKVVVGIVKVVSSIITFLAPIVARIASIFMSVARVVGKVLGTIASVISTVLGPVISVISFIFGGMLKLVVWAVKFIFAVIDAGFRLIWAFLRPWLAILWETWQSIFKAVAAVVGALVMAVVAAFKWIVSAGASAWAWLTSATSAAWTWIKDAIVGAATTVWSFILTWFELMMSWVDKAWAFVTNVTSAAWKLVQKYIIDPVVAVVRKVMQLIQPLVNWVRDRFIWLARVLQPIINLIKTYIITPIQQAISWLYSAIAPVVSWVVSKFNWLKDMVIGAFNTMKNGIMSLWGGISDFFSGGIRGMANSVIEAFNWGIRKINSVKIPPVKIAGHTVFDGWDGAHLPEIPPFANGGFVDSATLALIGEAGREVVLPLTNPKRSMELLGQTGLLKTPEARGMGMGGGSGTTVDKSVKIENLYVTTTPVPPEQIGKELLWSLRAAVI